MSEKQAASYRKGLRLEEQTGGVRKTEFRDLAKVACQFLMPAAAFNLCRAPEAGYDGSAAGEQKKALLSTAPKSARGFHLVNQPRTHML